MARTPCAETSVFRSRSVNLSGIILVSTLVLGLKNHDHFERPRLSILRKICFLSPYPNVTGPLKIMLDSSSIGGVSSRCLLAEKACNHLLRDVKRGIRSTDQNEKTVM